MTVRVPPSVPKTIADWLAQPEELIQGPFDRKPGGPKGPGGWWIGSEVDVALDGRGYRPDIAG
jgi:hypothetical protein